VALVEAVPREVLEETEDALRLFLRDAVLQRPFDKDALLLRHLLGLLLAHRAAEQIGAAERVAGELLRDLHHLLLVDDDAVGRLQELVDERVEREDRRLPVFPLHEVVVHPRAHRSRPVEGDGGDDVLEAVGLEAAEEALHPVGLELEDALRLPRREELVGQRVVHRQERQIELPLLADEIRTRVDEPHGDLEHRQRLQPEEVELHEARRLDVTHVVLRDEGAALLVAEDRDVIPQRPLADHDARRVLARVARQPLELLPLIEQLLDARIAVVHRLELRLDAERLGDRERLRGRLPRDEVRDGLRLDRRDADAPRHVLHDALALQLRERRDLPDARLAVLLLHVRDDLVAPLHAEVDVEVGHADPLRVEEALEEEVIRDGIEVRDAHRVRDDAPRTRAAPRADGDAALLRVTDEVPHDEEVAGELHRRDDVELDLEPLRVRLAVDVLALHRELLDAAEKPLARHVAEVALGVVPLGHLEAREHRLAQLERELAPLGDGERVRDGLRMRREELGHLGGRLQEHLARAVVALLRLLVRAARLDAREVEVRLGVGALGVVHVVRRHERQRELGRELHEDAVEHRLLRQPVVLQLDVQAPRLQRVAQRHQRVPPPALPFFEDRLRHETAHAPRRHHEALRVPRHVLHRERRALHVRARAQPHEVLVSLVRRRERRQVHGVAPAADHLELAPEDGLHVRLLRRLVERDGAEHVAVVRHGDGGHPRRGDALDEVLHLHRPVEERVLRVHVEVDELGGHPRR
jgi:hypothetical protein